MKRIIYQNDEGGISVYIPSPNSKTPLADQVRRHVPQDREHHIVNASDLPERDEFRNAWEMAGEKISDGVAVSFPKAADIKKNILRAERKALFEKLDADYMVAIKDGADTKELDKERKRLQDITKLCDKAKDISELKAITINDETDTEDSIPS